MLITSTSNPRVKSLRKLRKRRERDKSGKVLIEGYRELLRALDNNYPIEELYICPDLFIGKNEPALIQRVEEKGVQVITLAPDIFRKTAYRDRPEGLLAVGPQQHLGLDDLQLGKTPLLIVVEAIEKPGNLGTILRSADATGVDALILCDACTDLYNPNVVRASTGTLFTIPVAEADSESTAGWLHRQNIRTLAATPHSDTLYTDTDMTGATAIIVGTEQYGLSPFWMNNAQIPVRIPMLGTADSLNVANATTLLLYEAVRQRGGPGANRES
ncbi:MAG: RNA methyltransferase [Lentisphaeria bacterium]